MSNQNESKVRLTWKIIHSAGTYGKGFNADQLRLLGVSWPPRKGWLSALVGTEIDRSKWETILALKGVRPNQRKKIMTTVIPEKIIIRCDGCARSSDSDSHLFSEPILVSVTKRGVTSQVRTFDLCDECSEKMVAVINDGCDRLRKGTL